MFKFAGLDMKHTAAAIVCTVLFSATCVLSAVGPAKANSTVHPASPVVVPLA